MTVEREKIAEEHTGVEAHPGPKEYVRIAVILAIATALEVALYYLEQIPDPIIIALLMFFMVLKFVLVILWFMHLKFDNPLLTRLFVAGIILAVTVYAIVLLTFGVFIG